MKNDKKLKADEDCEICEGKGWIPIKEGDPEYEKIKKKWGKMAPAYATTKRCQCLLKKQFRRWVGEPIYNARQIDESPLVGQEDENLFIWAEPHDLLAHLRFFLLHHEQTFFWRHTTDSYLRDIFVGENDEYSSLSGFIKNPELVIIELAVLSYKNVAMSGTVLEALRTRRFEGKATWIANPYDAPFNEGHLAWSPDLEYFIEENFKVMKLPKTKRTSKFKGSDTSDLSSGVVGQNDKKKRPNVQDQKFDLN